MRRSKQRDLILEIINISTNHLTAEEVYNEARKTIKNISLGTVYRNINSLVDDKKILRIKTNESYDRFDNTKIKHNHFICEECNKVTDVFNSVRIKKDIINNYIVNDYEIKFKGICSDCINKGGK